MSETTPPNGAHTFENTSLAGATFTNVAMSGVQMRNVDLRDARIEGLLLNANLSGPIAGLRVNDVEVEPLIRRDLDRRHPELADARSGDPARVGAALESIEAHLDAALARARALPEDARHERVNDEWSAVETLRHLVFVVDAWISRALLGEEHPFHAIALPPSHVPVAPDGIDTAASPSFDEARAVWTSRLATLRDAVGMLGRASTTTSGPGYPPPGRTVDAARAIGTTLHETFWHARYMHRDLSELERAHGAAPPAPAPEPDSPRSCLRDFEAALQAKDVDAVLLRVARDAVFWFSTGDRHEGRDAVRDAIRANFEAIAGERYEMTDVTWIDESDDAAACTFGFRWSGVVGGTPASGSGRGTSVLRREGALWRIVHEHLSSG